MAPPADPPTTITLRIKVPPGHIEGGLDEFMLGTEVPVIARIGEVRERIQRVVPSNPAPERQRLLYGGRALVDNEQTLAEALNIRRDPTQTEYVVHLLVKGDGTATAPLPQRRGLSTQGRASPAQTGLPTAPPNDNAQQPGHVHLPHDIQAHHNHLHHQNVLQHHQQQHAAMLAQQQQQHLPHHMHHLGQFGTGPGPEVFGRFGMQPMPFAGGVAMAPGIPHVHPPPPPGPLTGLPPGPHPNAQHAPNPAAAQAQSTTDSAAESHSAPTLGPDAQADAQQRSASQPPPRPRGQGMILEGRGPNGERFHIQQHIQLGPQAIVPNGLGLPPMPHAHQQQPLRNVPSALDRARGNVAEMRRMLVELRALDVATDEQRDRINIIQQRIQDVNNYIDPFNLGGFNATATRAANTAQGVPMPRASSQPAHAPMDMPRSSSTQQPSSFTSSPSDVRCYLLSSPSGPHALLLSPEFGAYTTPNYGLQPTPTTQATTASAHQNAPLGNQDQAVAAAAAAPPQVAPAQPPVAQQDGLGVFGAGLINHMWLLMRVLIFAYFILGANLGWQRPLALVAIAIGFWLLRQGPLAEGGVLRRWWDGIVNQNPRAQPAGAVGQQQGQEGAGALRPGQMPTPAQVAQRILEEDRQQRNNRLAWIREQIRPAERAVALLVASLWPGVGEAYVRALEAEERRRIEEEIAARRREEEERQKREEDEKKRAEDAAEASSTVAKDGSEAGASPIPTVPDSSETAGGIEKKGDHSAGSPTATA
ncbi:hypothetical protein CB0940_03041 [Cercospora beticola]|uniref:Ubiquitin-like domain-containing protein n=1 Tax=Cercospora beticola TaxID=122368 RepID=A0A2G5I4H7_CERBT|nr:hypothetical protein CB0940_03041 [Cercospora beticola]PIA99393.1 hypothetical protein CB0940_03041 [Cercospora beticola]WPB00209.1 hypothetical protein RHO25_004828 [Cercospora beticola]CAK1361595.1 unnamed protein product [Cercospora beticola]